MQLIRVWYSNITEFSTTGEKKEMENWTKMG